jgi:hypothetical protein
MKTLLSPIKARERVEEIHAFAKLLDLPIRARADVDRMSWWVCDPGDPETALNGEEFSLDEWGPFALGFAHGFVYHAQNPDQEVDVLKRRNTELRFRMDQILDWANARARGDDSEGDDTSSRDDEEKPTQGDENAD